MTGSSIAKLAVVAALDYPYRGTAKALSCERLPTIPSAKRENSAWQPHRPYKQHVDRLSRFEVERNYVSYLAQRCQSAPTLSPPKTAERRRSGRRLPNRWDIYPWHGYYRDASSVTSTNKTLQKEHKPEHRTLYVQKGQGTKPNNSMKKSVVMSRRAVPLQIVETAI